MNIGRRCLNPDCRRVARHNGYCHTCLGDEPWDPAADLPNRLAWLNLDRLQRCHPQPGWEHNGNCYKTGVDPFYPDNTADMKKVRARCNGCPARYACLATALTTPAGDYGIWGGTTRLERTKIRGAIDARQAAA